MVYVARLQLEKHAVIAIWVLLKMIGQEYEFSRTEIGQHQNLRQDCPHSQLLDFGRYNRSLGSVANEPFVLAH